VYWYEWKFGIAEFMNSGILVFEDYQGFSKLQFFNVPFWN